MPDNSNAYPDTLDATGQSPRMSALVILLVVSAIMVPMAFMGVPDGFDLMQHIRFASSYRDALLAGELIPKWPVNDNFGFGGIGIRYYPPLAYYVYALTRIVTGSWYHSFWITTYGWALLGSTGVFLWVKEWASNRAATFAAILYILVPYHTFQIYQAVLYAEFAASGIVPFCFLYLSRVCSRRRWIDAILLAVSFGLLILTHIPTAIIASMCMAVYGLLIIDWREFKDTAVKLLVAVSLSALAASFHLVKALTEVDWVQHNSPQFFGKGYYDYKSYFFPIYFSAQWNRYVEKILWHLDTIILLTILLFSLTAVVFFVDRYRRAGSAIRSKDLRAVIITGVFSIFMLSVGSSYIWDHASFLAKLQFPWRWLSIASVMGSAAFAVATLKLVYSGQKLNRLVMYPVAAFILTIVLFDISQNILPSTPLQKDVFDDKIANMYNEEGCQCWWPVWAKSAAFGQPERAFAGLRNADVLNWTEQSRDFSVAAGDEGELRVATFYHPYWTATVNGEPAAVTNDANGAILVKLPAEVSKVHLFFKEPGSLHVAAILSLVVWISFAVFLMGYFVRLSRNRPVGV